MPGLCFTVARRDTERVLHSLFGRVRARAAAGSSRRKTNRSDSSRGYFAPTDRGDICHSESVGEAAELGSAVLLCCRSDSYDSGVLPGMDHMLSAFEREIGRAHV